MTPKIKSKYQVIMILDTNHIDTAITKLENIGDMIALTKLNKYDEIIKCERIHIDTGKRST